MEDKEREEVMEQIKDNFEKMDLCNETLKKMKKIEEVLDGEE